MSRTTMSKLLFAAPIAALALSGCVSLGAGKPPKVLLDLTPSASVAAGATVSGAGADAIAVLEPSADQKLSVTRVPVQVSASTVAYLKDATWVDRPAHLFQHLLAETLRAHGGHVVLEGDVASADTQLGGRLIDMGYDARSQSAVVRFEAVKRGKDGSMMTRRFEDVVPGVRAEAAPVAAALNEAANKVAGEVADWAG
ncbi:MAG: membrane integrity-associated transporter subunit PqiC [Sphingomonadales bacterium]|nr:membrane integrity-associated transporter subunit PqiC [Sphingomonadales bacterium]MDE2567487.1 membrane integrity-associated transporter subunit PqiC [Sphingomonadales bacterium]